MGSEFNSITKLNILKKLASNKKVSDYFELKTDIVSDIKNVLSYDLTHTLGNFIHDIEVSEHITGQRKLAKENDFIISRLRSYLEEFAVVEKRNNEQVFSSEYLVYRPTSNKVSSSLLVAYCLTKEVQTILNCSQYGTAHPRFFEFVFSKLPIPIALISLNSHIEMMFIKAFQLRDSSKLLYKQSEELLLKELDLLDFEPLKEKISVKTFSESFGDSGRLDSEYYQPKYDEIIEKIKSYKGGYKKLEYFSENYSTGYPFKSDSYVDDGTYLIRINNIKRGYLDISNASKIPNSDKELSSKDIAIENDILISMSGTIGNSCKIPKNISAVINQRIMKITPQKINFELLPLLINSIIGQNQLERIGTGGVQTNISSSDILSILIPIIDKTIQIQIEEKIKESFKLKEESKQLLEVAKKAVEIAIEDGEDLAMEFINED